MSDFIRRFRNVIIFSKRGASTTLTDESAESKTGAEPSKTDIVAATSFVDNPLT